MAGSVIIVRGEGGWECDRRGGKKVAGGVIVVRGRVAGGVIIVTGEGG